MACGILVSQLGIEPIPSALKVWKLNDSTGPPGKSLKKFVVVVESSG